MNEFRNPNGTYNGVAMLAKLSGLPEKEIAWTAARIKQLMAVEGKPKSEALSILREEAKAKPWDAQEPTP